MNGVYTKKRCHQTVDTTAVVSVCKNGACPNSTQLPPPARAPPPPHMWTRVTPLSCHAREQVVYIDTAKSDVSVDRAQRIKAVWYVMLSALEDVETQRRGFCFVVNFKNAQLSQVGGVSYVCSSH